MLFPQADKEGINLLTVPSFPLKQSNSQKMLLYDPAKRITTQFALSHRYLAGMAILERR